MSSDVEEHQEEVEELDSNLADIPGAALASPTDAGSVSTAKDKIDEVVANSQGQLKPPPYQLFYAVRKCDSLKAPAIFFSFDDANVFVELENEEVEFKEFNVILDAMEYLYQNVTIPGKDDINESAENQEATTADENPDAFAAGPSTETPPADDVGGTTALDGGVGGPDPSSDATGPTDLQEVIPLDAAPNLSRNELRWTQPVPVIPHISTTLEPIQTPPSETASPTKVAKNLASRQSAQRTRAKKPNTSSGSSSAPVTSSKKRARTKSTQEKESPSKRPRKKETKIVRMFDEKFELLKQYKEQYGTCDVPFNNKNTAGGKYEGLGKWVRSMRVKIKSSLDNPDDPGSLHKTKVQRLLDLGFVMSPHRWAKPHTAIQKTESSWEGMFEELKKFKEENGHLNVPHRPSTALRSWVVKQRRDYEKLREGKNSALTAQNMARLAGIGFKFSTFQRMSFDERVEQYTKYKEKHGCEPKRLSEDGLGKWVCSMRQKYALLAEGKTTNLKQEQADLLTSLGFKWSSGQKKPERNGTPNKSWDTRLQELYEFKQQHGTASVPQHYPELGNWVHKQRTEYKKFLKGESSIITPERFRKLTEAGFVFEAKKRRGKRGLPGFEAAAGSRAAGRANNSNEYDSDGSSSQGDDRGVGGSTGFEQPGNQATHPSFRNFSFDPRAAQNTFSPWDRYANANSGSRVP